MLKLPSRNALFSIASCFLSKSSCRHTVILSSALKFLIISEENQLDHQKFSFNNKITNFNSFENNFIRKMCSNATEMEIGTPDGVTSALRSEDSNQAPNVDANTGGVQRNVSTRNVLIQHGDYRSVDEENIVVLKRCLSPQPSGAAAGTSSEHEDGEQKISADDQPGTSQIAVEEQYLWIEPFADDDSEVSFH